MIWQCQQQRTCTEFNTLVYLRKSFSDLICTGTTDTTWKNVKAARQTEEQSTSLHAAFSCWGKKSNKRCQDERNSGSILLLRSHKIYVYVLFPIYSQLASRRRLDQYGLLCPWGQYIECVAAIALCVCVCVCVTKFCCVSMYMWLCVRKHRHDVTCIYSCRNLT